ncbi:MAG: hypothetical protein KF787_01260 [Phycisphaeraceae bacterium]|nr:hypothetical protein [Phycisphaerae bacterium]MBX3391252.1 hypothetical protein [Phycisphaeraceae bacterium]
MPTIAATIIIITPTDAGWWRCDVGRAGLMFTIDAGLPGVDSLLKAIDPGRTPAAMIRRENRRV